MTSVSSITGYHKLDVLLRMRLAYLPTDGKSSSPQFPYIQKQSLITLAAVSLHNYLRVHATDTYLPAALADTEGESHHLIPGSWRSDATLPSVPAGRDRNGTRTAKEQHDKLKDYFVSAAGSVCWQ